MATINDFDLGSTVSFDVWPEGILGTGFKRMKVMGFLDADSARNYIDPVSMHANVFPTLPEGSAPDDPYDYHYVKLKMVDGGITCVGLPWIKAASIEVHESNTLKLTIENISTEDIERVKTALAANGFRAVDIRIV